MDLVLSLHLMMQIVSIIVKQIFHTLLDLITGLKKFMLIMRYAMKKKLTSTKLRNFVAKNAPKCGAGMHEDKTGKRAKRARQTRAWKTLIKEILKYE